MKTILNISLALFVLIFLNISARAQTPNDELFPESEPQGEKTELLHAGGAPEEEVNATPLYNEKAVELRLSNVRDSIMHIPAYDTYCTWDTKNLFANRGDVSSLGEGVLFELMQTECDFHYPAPGIMTSPFGPRWGRMHYGLDIDLEVGDNVYAAFEGMVRISQYHSSYGNVVVVRHNNGLETLYAHMSQRKVAPGDHVEAGDVLGLGGNTGRSYGAHLHFEVRYLGQAFDPRLIVDPSAKQLNSSNFTLLSKHFDAQPLAPQVAAARAGTSNSSGKSAKSGKSPSKGAKTKYHTIKKGDTLSAIARKNGTTVNALCKLNKIKATSTLHLGQRIRVK